MKLLAFYSQNRYLEKHCRRDHIGGAVLKRPRNHLETFSFVSAVFSDLMRAFSEGFPVTRAKDIVGFGLSDGLKSVFTRVLPAAKIALQEHTRVKAVADIHEGDETVLAGATGTIVHVIKGGVGYDVEFTSPRHVIISASRAELTVA